MIALPGASRSRPFAAVQRALAGSRAPAAVPATPTWLVGTAFGLALLFAGFYLLGVPLRASQSAWINVDEPFYLLTTISILQDGDLDLANDYAEFRYRAFFDHPEDLWYQSAPATGGRILSPHNVGVSVLTAPAYALGGAAAVKGFLALLGGLTVGCAALLAYRVCGHAVASVAAASLLGVTAPFFVYATQIYPEMPAALLVTLGAWLALGRRPGTGTALAGAGVLLGLVWLGSKYGVLGSVLGLWLLLRLTPRARLLFAGLLVAGGGFYAAFHVATYGGLTPYAVNRLYAGSSTLGLLELHFEFWNRLYRVLGLWVDAEFGLLRWAPVLLLVFPALPIFLRRAGRGSRLVVALFVVQFLVAIFLSITMRGWWFPGRMLIAVLPLLAVPLGVALAAARPRVLWWAAAAVFGGWSLGLTLALRAAVDERRITLAVDPFNLAWAPFAALRDAFPLYTSYAPPTLLLSAVWVLVLAGLVAGGWYLDRRQAPAGASASRAVALPLPDGAGHP